MLEYFLIQDMSERVGFIDIAKGIGILLVVWFHFPNLEDLLNFTKWGGWITTFYMPLFFLLSGLFFKPFSLLKKIKRLLIPYLGFYLISFVLYILKNILKCEPIDWLRFFNPFCGVIADYENPPIWFLLSLAQITAFFYAMSLVVHNRNLGLIISLLISLMGYIIGLKVSLPYYIDVSMLCYLFFALGYYYKDWILGIDVKTGFMLGLISILLYVFCPGFTNVSVNEIPMGYVPFTGIAVCASLFIVAISKAIERTFVAGGLAWFGEHSLIILCTHISLLIIPSFFLKLSFNIYLAHFMGMFVVLFIEVFLVLFINKYASFLLGK